MGDCIIKALTSTSGREKEVYSLMVHRGYSAAGKLNVLHRSLLLDNYYLLIACNK